jgi:Spy/CpxP family protein refolding chaperone
MFAYARVGLALASALLLTCPILAQVGGAAPAGGAQSWPDMEMLPLQQGVQQELHVTEQQKSQLDKIEEQFRKNQEMVYQAGRTGNRERAIQLMCTMRQDAVKAINEVKSSFTQAQWRRLTQLEVQFLGFRVFAMESYQNYLQLTEPQRGDLQQLAERMRIELAQTTGNLEERIAKVRALDRAAFKLALGYLTPEQKAKWDELAGARFDFASEEARAPGGEPER